MPTKVGVVFMVVLIWVSSGCAPGVSRPCYAAWWPGDCSGSGRDEERGGGPRFFTASRASGAAAYPPDPHVMAARQAAIGNIQGGAERADPSRRAPQPRRLKLRLLGGLVVWIA